MSDRTTLSIGAFDGVHRGHAALLGRARDLAASNGTHVVALAFEPHPLTTLAPGKTPPRLTSWTQRRRLLEAAGADRVERLAPTKRLLDLTAEAFVDWLVETHNPAAITEGPDFRFGRGREGDVATLARLGDERGFTVKVVPTVDVDLVDQTIAPCSSTLVRWLLANGRVADAARALGRPYQLTGLVAQGEQRGRSLGWPTANLSCEVTPPRDGVYAAAATLPDGTRLPAALSVGVKPTFAEARYDVEAHIIGWDGALDGVEAGYDWRLDLDLIAWQREQIRYDNVQELIAQMERDVALCQEIVADDLGDAVRTAQGVGA